MADHLRCDKCNQDFQSQDEFQRHNQDQHQGQGGGSGSGQQGSVVSRFSIHREPGSTAGWQRIRQ